MKILFGLILDYWCMSLRCKYVQEHAAMKEAEYRRAEAQYNNNLFDRDLRDALQQTYQDSYYLRMIGKNSEQRTGSPSKFPWTSN